MQCDAERGCRERIPLRLRQTQQSNEHGRNEMGMRDLAPHQQLERLRFVPLGHDQDRCAIRIVVDGEHQGRRVIHRTRNQMRAAPIETHRIAHFGVMNQSRPHTGGSRALDTLWSTGRTTRVDHVAASRPIQIERPRTDAIEHAIQLVSGLDDARFRPLRRHPLRDRRVLVVRDQNSTAGVLYDVVDLFFGQMPVDRRHPLTRDHGANQELDHFNAIAHQERHMATRLETRVMPKKARKAMTSVEELSKGPLPGSIVDREFSCAIPSEFEEHIFLLSRPGGLDRTNVPRVSIRSWDPRGSKASSHSRSGERHPP